MKRASCQSPKITPPIQGYPPEFGDRSEFDGRFNIRCELGTSPILVAVADGMGGAGAGNVASTEALRFLAARFETLVEDDDVPAQLLKMIEATNDHVWNLCNRPEMGGSGTTLTAAFFLRGSVFFLQVGDSCGYGFRRGELRRLVTIQNTIEYFRAMGFSFREFHGPSFPALIGPEQIVEPELTEILIEPGDIFLLCTDGFLPYDENGDFDGWLPDVMRSSSDLSEIEQKIFDHAEQDGFRDNASSILVKVIAAPNS